MSDAQALVQGVIIPADPHAPMTVGQVDASPHSRATIVDGQTEIVLLGDERGMLYVNAYGKSEGLAPNPRATRFVNQYVPGFAKHDTIMGSVLIVGYDENGKPSDLNDTLRETAVSWQVSPT